MDNKIRLSDIFEINTGQVLSRKQSKTEEFINYKQIALKSINENGYIELNKLEEFKSKEEINGKYITRKGDIVIRLTAPYTAIAIDEKTEGLLVNSYCAILRKKIDDVSSEYISIYLNSGKISKQFRRDAVGSVVQIIKVSSLKDYKIDNMPSFEKQMEIVEVNKMMTDEILILEELILKKLQFKKGIINKLLEIDNNEK